MVKRDFWPLSLLKVRIIHQRVPLGDMGKTMTLVRGLAAAVFLVAASGCAKAPASIAPAYVSEIGYLNWSCEQLAGETARMSAAYANAAKQQEQARTNDVVGVILIGLPVSSMSGDNIAPEIARLKGEQEAIRKAMIAKQCAPATIAPPQAPAKKEVKKTPSEG